jgi:histidinol dehydrogenase
MRIKSYDWEGRDAATLAAEIRALQPPLGEVSETVAEIIAAVRERGDDAVAELEARFGGGGVDPHTMPVAIAEVRASLERIDPQLDRPPAPRRPGDRRGEHPRRR